MKKIAERKCRKIILESIFSPSRKRFQSFAQNSKISYFLSVSHNPELRCVSALVLHLNCTAQSHSIRIE